MATEINKFILSFVFLLVGAILIGVVADEVTSVNQPNNVNNETITLTNGSVTSLANSQLDSFTSLINATNESDVFVLDTDYTVDLNVGTVTSLAPSGGANATYVYRDLGNATARSLTSLIIVFFAIGIFMAGVGFAVAGLREAGVL